MAYPLSHPATVTATSHNWRVEGGYIDGVWHKPEWYAHHVDPRSPMYDTRLGSSRVATFVAHQAAPTPPGPEPYHPYTNQFPEPQALDAFLVSQVDDTARPFVAPCQAWNAGQYPCVCRRERPFVPVRCNPALEHCAKTTTTHHNRPVGCKHRKHRKEKKPAKH
jgi:hypothetical protein